MINSDIYFATLNDIINETNLKPLSNLIHW
jgi:hypothetical protein